jgi:hypothetical protein
MSPIIRFDQFILHSDDEKSSSFQIRKALGKYSFAEVEIFETKTCISIISLLTNKIISLSEPSISNKQVIFKATFKGTFKEIIDAENKLNKLLRIDTSLFTPLITSSQRFHDSITLEKTNYSVAFVLLIFSLEGISNILYEQKKHWTKRKKLVRFVEKHVKNERFTKAEIRQLDFQGKQKNIDLVFRELLSQSYQYRCDYVHDGKMLPTLSKTADRLSMAFISNDQISVFPSYSWLRRITNLALVNFLNQEHEGRNSLSQYFHSYEIAKFKAKRAFPKGQKLDENYVYLQRLTDDFFEFRKRL